jgi:hypothetical protein
MAPRCELRANLRGVGKPGVGDDVDGAALVHAGRHIRAGGALSAHDDVRGVEAESSGKTAHA